MTTVHVDLRHPDGDETDASSAGYLVWTPSIRVHIDEADDYIRLPQPFTAKLVAGKVDVDVAPTEPAWYWKVKEKVPRGTTRYVLVPDQAEVEYGDLVDIDPDSYDPVSPGIPGWVPVTEDLQDQIDALDSVIGGVLLVYKGAWNPSTNTPVLVDGVGTLGDFYQASINGSVDLGSGLIAFTAGDYVEYDGTVWSRIPSTYPLPPDTGWLTPVFENTWANYGGGFSEVEYRKTGFDDRVTIKGVAGGGTNATAVFILPVGFRPSNNEMFDGYGNAGVTQMFVNATGEVIVVTSGSTTYVTMSLSFLAG